MDPGDIGSEEVSKESESKPICRPSSCYQTATQSVWTHGEETLHTSQELCYRQGYTRKETHMQASDGWTITGDIWPMDDQMIEDRKVWSKMVATVDTR